MCFDLQLRAGAGECEGFLPPLGRPGHCSSCSLAVWEGMGLGLPAATLASSPHRARGLAAAYPICFGDSLCLSHLLALISCRFVLES